MGINDFIRRLKPRERLFLFFLLALVTGLMVYNFSVNLKDALIAVGILSGLLLFTRNLWLPKEYRSLASLLQRIGLIGSVIASVFVDYKNVSSSFKWLEEPGVWIVSKLFPASLPKEEKERLTRGCIAILLLLFFFIVNYFIKRRTWGSHRFPGLPGLEQDRKQSQEVVIDALKTDIIDNKNRRGWDCLEFKPMEAEVEININNRRKKRVDDLLSAITKNKRSQFFLVLGEPGSGKSMALIRLAEDMLTAAPSTGVIPLHVNLNEWDFPEPGESHYDKPDRGLTSFVEEKFVERMPLPKEVARSLFLALDAQRKFFFIFDSFDEIPALVNANDASAPAGEISEAISNFSGLHRGNRIILSSRLFRRPVGLLTRDVVLEIRPFAELRFGEVLKDSGLFGDIDLKTWIIQKPVLASWLANPFTLNLFIYYFRWHPVKTEPPEALADMYRFYFEHTLSTKRDRIHQEGLTISQVIDYCQKIALLLYSDIHSGMYIEKARLIEPFPEIEPGRLLNILVDLKIGQFSGQGESRFSFNHRRFIEYLVSIGAHDDRFFLNEYAIPEHTRDRDIWILYCEVSSTADAEKVADFCWRIIYDLRDTELDPLIPKHYQAILCLLFLREAFLYRKECIVAFQHSLYRFILLQAGAQNPLTQKYAAEAAALLPPTEMEHVIIRALKTKNTIIQEAAFKTGKISLEVGPKLQSALERYLLGIGVFAMLGQGGEIRFALQLFPTLEKARRYYRLVEWDNYLYIIGCLFLACNLQTLVVFVVFMLPIFPLMQYGQDLKRVKKHTVFWQMMDKSNQFILTRFRRHLQKTWKVVVVPEKINISPGGFAKFQIRIIFNLLIVSFISYVYFSRLGFVLEVIGWVLTVPLLLAYLIYRSGEITRPVIKYYGLAALYFSIFYCALVYPVSQFTTESQQDIIGYTLLCCFAIWVLIPSSLLLAKDMNVFNKAKRKTRVDRYSASQDLTAIHFSFYQFKYIRQVFQNRAVEVTGQWPDNQFPIDASSPAGQLLMKLEQERLRDQLKR